MDSGCGSSINITCNSSRIFDRTLANYEDLIDAGGLKQPDIECAEKLCVRFHITDDAHPILHDAAVIRSLDLNLFLLHTAQSDDIYFVGWDWSYFMGGGVAPS